MKTDKPYKDIEDVDKELSELDASFRLVDNKMIAVGLDYKFFIDSKSKADDIFDLRNNVLYRLRATRFHIHILMNILDSMNKELESGYQQSTNTPGHPPWIHMLFENRVTNVSALFDSIIFHLVSAFDYVGNLVGYISIGQKKMKWTQLAKSVRDTKNDMSKLNFSGLIDRLDRDFAGRLYDHRSYIIHVASENRRSSFTHNLMNDSFEAQISSSQKFTKNFPELKDLSKDYDLSISYVVFWMLKRTLTSIIEIQYGLKSFMEENKKVDKPMMFRKGPNNEILPPSGPYWENK